MRGDLDLVGRWVVVSRIHNSTGRVQTLYKAGRHTHGNVSDFPIGRDIKLDVRDRHGMTSVRSVGWNTTSCSLTLGWLLWLPCVAIGSECRHIRLRVN